MNFNLTQIPERTAQPRTHGITMVMDKGLSIQEVHNFLSIAKPHVDVVRPTCVKKLKFILLTVSPFILAEPCLKLS
jgi:hypothetical protein